MQQPKSGLRRLIVVVSRSHTIRHKRSTGLLRTSDHLVVETVTYTTNTTD